MNDDGRLEDNWPSKNPWRTDDAELPYGWAGKSTIFVDEYEWREYNRVVKWLLENIENTTSNVHWLWCGDRICLQFRKAKDFTLFSLRWGA